MAPATAKVDAVTVTVDVSYVTIRNSYALVRFNLVAPGVQPALAVAAAAAAARRGALVCEGADACRRGPPDGRL